MKPADREAAARAIFAFIEALGYEPGSGELRGTPERVAAAFIDELLIGERSDLAELIRTGSEAVRGKPPGMVLVRDIAVTCICPHHLLPAVGRASVAYLPGERLLGLGTVAHVVDACARRLSLQESVGENVVQALLSHGGARGAFCKLDLLHTCLSARGAEKPEARLVTLAHGGALAEASAQHMLAQALERGSAA
jgi:GTP cyclohydrolase IA